MKILMVADKYSMSSHQISNGYRVGKAFEDLGHEVCIMRPEMASTVAGKADFILGFNSLLHSHRLFLNNWIAKEKKPDAKFAIWYCDSCSEIDKENKSRNAKIMKIIPYIDMLITTDHSFPWENYINNYMHLYQGVDFKEFDYTPSNSKDRTYDIIFTGGLYNRESERLQSIKEIGSKFKSIVYTSSKVDKSNGLGKLTVKPSVYEKDFFDVYQQAKIAYIPRPPSSVKADYWSNRIYLATATGTCCLVEYVKGLESEFTNFKEVVYSFDNEDTVRKIKYLLADPNLRMKLGRNARKRTLDNYKYSDRVKKILEVL